MYTIFESGKQIVWSGHIIRITEILLLVITMKRYSSNDNHDELTMVTGKLTRASQLCIEPEVLSIRAAYVTSKIIIGERVVRITSRGCIVPLRLAAACHAHRKRALICSKSPKQSNQLRDTPKHVSNGQLNYLLLVLSNHCLIQWQIIGNLHSTFSW
jgi:hypothetical protein